MDGYGHNRHFCVATVGDAMLTRSVGEATGRSEKWIKSTLKEEGDLGRVAVLARVNQKTLFTPKPLTAARVLSTFHKIASTKGERSGEEKRNKIKQLLVSCRENEAGYVVRALQGKLKIGVAEQSVLVALGQAVLFAKEVDGTATTPADANEDASGSYAFSKLAKRLEDAAAAVKEAFSVCPSYDVLVPELLRGGTEKLNESIVCTIGVPVKCMLAKPTKGVHEVVQRFADVEFTCEYKYDGERAQVHVSEDGSARVYSRNAENTTPKYPDVCDIVKRARKESAKSIVVDGEVVAYNRETKKIEAFQKLSTRNKKDTAISDIKVTICYFAFDLLYLNGRPLLSEPLVERRRLLRESIAEIEGECHIATSMESTDIDELQTFLDASVRDGTEGLIVKTLRENATYEPSKRSLNWLKLKKDYIDNLGDSLDLVPIGAWHGKGKRTGVYGAFLLACYDDDTERYQTICKVGTGFSESLLVELSETLAPKAVSDPPKYYDWAKKKLEPDVWFEPAFVWEVKAADLSISPVHLAAAGQVDGTEKGIALRFPRLIRQRDDKKPEMATTAAQVLEFYTKQALVMNSDE